MSPVLLAALEVVLDRRVLLVEEVVVLRAEGRLRPYFRYAFLRAAGPLGT